jgi:hypothetical protein
MKQSAEKIHRSIYWGAYDIDQLMIMETKEKHRTMGKVAIISLLTAIIAVPLVMICLVLVYL